MLKYLMQAPGGAEEHNGKVAQARYPPAAATLGDKYLPASSQSP